MSHLHSPVTVGHYSSHSLWSNYAVLNPHTHQYAKDTSSNETCSTKVHVSMSNWKNHKGINAVQSYIKVYGNTDYLDSF